MPNGEQLSAMPSNGDEPAMGREERHEETVATDGELA
jgi:hypothetical protein